MLISLSETKDICWYLSVFISYKKSRKIFLPAISNKSSIKKYNTVHLCFLCHLWGIPLYLATVYLHNDISVSLDVTLSLVYGSFSNFLFDELYKCSSGAVFFRIMQTTIFEIGITKEITKETL